MDLIRERLLELQPETLEIIDDSEKHRGHPGASTGAGHFKVIIKAKSLSGLSRLESHRAIYQRINDLIPKQIHALQIELLSR
jgi:BolA family transcriptional regulator, general stress-responsive regulator